MYAASQDPYCIPGTTILKNLAELDDQEQLDQLELLYTTQRLLEPLPMGSFSVGHYKAVHRHIFQDIYSWAGEFRSVRISKGQSSFCYPEHIESEMQKLFR
jgi:cell filamentation protein